MKENSTLKEKLKSYSMLAGAVVASGTAANADILYSNPNTLINTDGASFNIDLNCDGANDVSFQLNKSLLVDNGQGKWYYNYSNSSYYLGTNIPGKKGINSFAVNGLGSLVVASMTTSSYQIYGAQFGLGEDIGNLQQWGAVSKMGKKNIQWGYYTSGSGYGQNRYSYSTDKGPWGAGTGLNDTYVGLRLGTTPNFYYGWAKIRIGADLNSVTLVEYAMNDVLNQPIVTGKVNGFANTPTAISILDSTDNDNASDLVVKFTLSDTSNTKSLRAIAFKTADAVGFDACDAWKISSTNYVTIAKNSGVAGKYVANFTGKNDGNGNPIVNGEQYTVFVYTRGKYDYTIAPNGVESNRAILVQSVNNVTLFGKAEPITALTLADTANNQNATDLLVTFNEPSNISKNSEYKVFVVKTDDAPTFDMTVANTVSSGNYKQISTVSSGSTISVPYTVGDKDINGDGIVACNSYTVFVQSIANQTTADRDVMIKSSAAITLLGQVQSVSNIVAQDVFDAANGSDLYFSFNPPANESNIYEYRIFAVPNASLATFNLTSVATNANYVQLDAQTNYFGTFTGKKDSEGNNVIENKEYTIFVVSMNNGDCVNKDNIAQSAAKITLKTILPAKVDNSTIIATDVADKNKPTDMQVVFNKPADMAGIGAFHIVVVSSDIAALNLAYVEANMLDEGYLTKVEVDSDVSGVYTVNLAAYHLDENSSKITNNRSYRVFIISEADGVSSYKNTISDSSATVVLRNYTGIANELEELVKINSYDNNINVTLDPTMNNNAIVTLYNSLGQVMESREVIGNITTFENIPVNGIYIVNVTVGDKQISKKVYIN